MSQISNQAAVDAMVNTVRAMRSDLAANPSALYDCCAQAVRDGETAQDVIDAMDEAAADAAAEREAERA